MLLSVGVNVALSIYLAHVARLSDSLALKARAAHVRTDVFTSAGVLAGLALVRLTGKLWIDPAAAIVVAALILRTAAGIIQEAFSPLIDARLPEEDEAAIVELLEGDPHVLGYHKLRTRKSGSQRHADVHVQIDDNYTLVQAHDVAEDIEDKIRAALPAISINIHIEPYHAELRHQREAHGAPDAGVETAPPDDAGKVDEGPVRPATTNPPQTGHGARKSDPPGNARLFPTGKHTRQ
jgi:cation diffusion facilitator family transporter